MKKSLLFAAALAASVVATSAYAGAEFKCKTCHNYERGAGTKIGPNLFGVVGRAAGMVSAFKYSEGVANSDIKWTEENLREWIADSKEMIEGTKMPALNMTGVKADEVIAFLNTLR